jgi:hypothetical protein
LKEMRRVLPGARPLPTPDPLWAEEPYRTAVVWLDVALTRKSVAATQENWGVHLSTVIPSRVSLPKSCAACAFP